MSFTDYYKELELERGASEEEIKKSFRRLARQYHPDTNPDNPNAEERFKRISEAYEVLSDSAKRAKYDQLSRQTSGRAWSGGSPGAGPSFSMDDVGDMFNGTSFGDLLTELFGQSRTRQRPPAGRQRQPTRRAQVSTITLTLSEALTGVTKRLTLDGKTIEVAFRPGIVTGQRLRVANVELDVTISPHPKFRREGDDLHTRHSIHLSTALLGGTVQVQTLSGETLSVKVPPGTQHDRKLRLKGQGMPSYANPQHRGDLYVTLDVPLPSALTDEQRALVERLQQTGL